jgi:hypothetical protein
VFNDCREVPEIWLCGDEAFPTRGEEEGLQGDGEEHEGVQGGEAGAGHAEEDHLTAGECQTWTGENNPDKLLQVTCRDQVNDQQIV